MSSIASPQHAGRAALAAQDMAASNGAAARDGDAGAFAKIMDGLASGADGQAHESAHERGQDAQAAQPQAMAREQLQAQQMQRTQQSQRTWQEQRTRQEQALQVPRTVTATQPAQAANDKPGGAGVKADDRRVDADNPGVKEDNAKDAGDAAGACAPATADAAADTSSTPGQKAGPSQAGATPHHGDAAASPASPTATQVPSTCSLAVTRSWPGIDSARALRAGTSTAAPDSVALMQLAGRSASAAEPGLAASGAGLQGAQALAGGAHEPAAAMRGTGGSISADATATGLGASAAPMPGATPDLVPNAAGQAVQAPTFSLALADTAAPVHHAALAAHPGHAAFGGELGAQVRLLVQGGMQLAELHLNPQDMGPIHIQLNLSGHSAALDFSAAHALTREAISQALPALREMLAGQGLSLGQASVSGGQQQGADGSASGARASRAASRDGAARTLDGNGGPAAATVNRAVLGMLDLYA